MKLPAQGSKVVPSGGNSAPGSGHTAMSIGVRVEWAQSAGIGRLLSSTGTWHFVWVCESHRSMCVCVCVCVCAVVKGKSVCL